MYVRRTSGNAVELAMRDDAVKQLKESAVDQRSGHPQPRGPVGVSEPTIAKRGDTQILVQLPGYSNPEKSEGADRADRPAPVQESPTTPTPA